MSATGRVTVHDCRFAQNGNALVEQGGAIFSTGVLQVSRTSYVRNEAKCGGACGLSLSSTATFEAVNFTDNIGDQQAGAVDIGSASTVHADSCRFESNRVNGAASEGGARGSSP